MEGGGEWNEGQQVTGFFARITKQKNGENHVLQS